MKAIKLKVVIDIGNTTITVGLSNDGENIDRLFRLNTEKNKSLDEYSLTLNGFIDNCDGAIVSSVVPELNKVFREYFEKNHHVSPLFVGTGVKTGIQINADNPKEVGTDLICNAVAAAKLYAETCLIVDLGTATTFTYLEKKILKGVVITTGLTTSKDALVNRTSLLPQVEFNVPKKVLGTNSVDCIKSGLLYGHAAMIDGMIQRIKSEVKNDGLKVILTGGHSGIIHPLCKEEITIDKRLILKGLLMVMKKNTGN